MTKVLIIDDSEFFRGVYSHALHEKGFQVDVAADGKSGLEKMLAELPQLVFLDYVMPDMSGEEVLREIQTHEQLKNIPIIMLTSISAEIAGANLLEIGPVAGYLKKEEASVDDVVRKTEEVLGSSDKPFVPTADTAQ